MPNNSNFAKVTVGHLGQGELFNEVEEKETFSDQHEKPKRKPLPREVIVHDISDDEKVCECFGG